MPPKKSKLANPTAKRAKRIAKKREFKSVIDLTNKVDYEDDNTSIAADELDEVPDLYDIKADNSLKERYEYKPVVRQDNVYLTPDNRRTSEIMTMFEYTEIIGQRAKQIENGGSCFTDVTGMTDPIKMAEKEMRDRKCPLNIIRQLSNNVAELWHANEMGFVPV